MSDWAAQLITTFFGNAQGHLLVGGVPIHSLADKYGTPFFVYDRGVVERKLIQLRNALPGRFEICYSVKANPNRMLLRYFLEHGCGLEVASAGELLQAVSAGCDPRHILFAGPGKTEAELELAIRHGIGGIHAESQLEVQRIAAISRRLGVRANVAVRVNPGGDLEAGAMRMGGKPAPFGVDEEALDRVLDELDSHSSIHFQGIHLFMGTQILDYASLLAQYRRGIQIARRVAARLGHPLQTLDFGGGLGIPYFSHERPLDTGKLRTELDTLVADMDSDPLFAGTQLLVEPGRYLVGEAGIFVARVNDIKVSRNKKFLILDGGMNHHLAASGNLGQTIKRNFPVALLNRLDSSPEETVDVVGPLCTPLDVLARDVALPRAAVGDLFGVFQSGAYARSASPLGFLSHPSPPEVWVDQGHDQLIRRRGDYSDFLRDLCPEPAGIFGRQEDSRPVSASKLR